MEIVALLATGGGRLRLLGFRRAQSWMARTGEDDREGTRPRNKHNDLEMGRVRDTHLG